VCVCVCARVCVRVRVRVCVCTCVKNVDERTEKERSYHNSSHARGHQCPVVFLSVRMHRKLFYLQGYRHYNRNMCCLF